jgi:hypothetical protein
VCFLALALGATRGCERAPARRWDTEVVWLWTVLWVLRAHGHGMSLSMCVVISPPPLQVLAFVHQERDKQVR